MSDRPDWAARIEKEEAAFLARCQPFVLASPHSPGGGDKDILYLTPCGRWLRISSRVAYYRDYDAGPGEVCHQVNSNMAKELFLDYWMLVPSELPDSPLPSDIEMFEEWGARLAPSGADGGGSLIRSSRPIRLHEIPT
jgi:hypothetical protein